MTCYEAYLITYTALGTYMSEHPGNEELTRLVDGMDPYALGFEASKDIYIYQRWTELWISETAYYTPSEENLGFTFARKFFKLLPKTDKRYQAGDEAVNELNQAQWHGAAMWVAVTSTYLLLYYMLKKQAAKIKGLDEFLNKMNPFDPEAGSFSHDHTIWDAYYEIACSRKDFYEISYEAASQFVLKMNDSRVSKAFSLFRWEDWENERENHPVDFRFLTD